MYNRETSIVNIKVKRNIANNPQAYGERPQQGLNFCRDMYLPE